MPAAASNDCSPRSDSAAAGDADGDGARLFAGEFGQFARGGGLHVGVHYQHRRVDRGFAYGCEILERIVGQVAAERRIDGDGADGREEQRVAVGIGLRHVLRGDGAVRARLVFNGNGFAEQARHPLGDEAGGDVGGATRREGNDQPHRTRRVILRVCTASE